MNPTESSGGPGALLAIVAHPDDAELWMGGTIALHARSAPAIILVASKDSTRRREAIESAGVLGATVEFVDRHSVRSCVEAIRRSRPRVVITHRVDDTHFDHCRTANIVVRSLTAVAVQDNVVSRNYTCDSYESVDLHGPITARVIIDVTETFDIKKAALAAHASQPQEHFQAMAGRLGALWGARIGVKWAEAFDPLPILGRVASSERL